MAGTKQQRFMGNVRRNPEKLVNSRPNTLEEIDWIVGRGKGIGTGKKIKRNVNKMTLSRKGTTTEEALPWKEEGNLGSFVCKLGRFTVFGQFYN